MVKVSVQTTRGHCSSVGKNNRNWHCILLQ